MTERNEPVDHRHEEALSAALHEHARSVRPAGDGLVRIRSRVQRRRRRVRFLAPLASLAAAAAAVTAIVASGLLTSGPKTDVEADVSTSKPATTTSTRPPATLPVTNAPSSTPSPSTVAVASSVPASTASASLVTTAPTTTTVVATNPNLVNPPVWPFADAAAASSWQQSSSQKPDESWHLDARNVAERFVSALELGLGLPHFQPGGTAPVLHDDGTATVDVTRTGFNGSTLVLGTVTLSHWTTGADAPWGVVSVTSPAASKFPLSIKAPLPGTAVTAPLSVSIGMVGGAEDDVYTSAWSAGAASPAVHNHDVLGTDKTETLPAAIPTSGTGFVAVLDGSSAVGSFGLSRLAVTPVRYGTESPVIAAAQTYVAVTDKGIEVRDVSTDAVLRTLAAGVKGVLGAEVSPDRLWLYYATAGVISRTRLDGTGTAQTVNGGAGSGNTIAAFALAGPKSTRFAYAIRTSKGGQEIDWTSKPWSSEGALAVSASMPPAAESIALSPDGMQLSAFVRTGTQGNVMSFDLSTAKSLADGTTPKACTSVGAECVGEAYAPNGDLLTVTSDGSAFTVYRQHGASVSRLFSVAGTGQGASLDTDPTGSKVLLTDNAGHGWMWGGSGTPRALSGHVIDASW